MKKAAVLFGLILMSVVVFCQVPQSFKYQTVIRDSNGDILPNQQVALKISILKDSVNGAEVFSEIHNETTNDFGLINTEIGSIDTITFTAINWSTDKMFISIEVDPAGGTSFQYMGVTQLLSVPYALHAAHADSVHISGNENAFSGWDKDNTDDFDGQYSSLSGTPADISSFNNDAGYITSESDPVWTSSISDYYTKTNMQTSGNSELHFDNITNTPSTVSGYGITDAISSSHPANNITSNDITNWDNAYGWGDHSSANYLLKSGGTMSGDLNASGSTTLAGFNAYLVSSTASAYSLSSSDNGKVITIDNSGSVSLTIPAGLTGGFNCLVVQKGTGEITFSAGTGVSLLSRTGWDKTAGQYAIATIIHIGGDNYVISGDVK